MPRTFTSGQATDPSGNATTNAQTVYANIKAALVANPAWTLVEEVTASNGYVNGVFRCAASAAGMAKDFYLVVTWNAASSLFFRTGEDYASPVLSAIPGDATKGLVLDANGAPSPPPTYNVSTGASANTSYSSPLVASTSVTASSYWAVVADVDGATIAVGAFALYVGAFQSLVQPPLTDPMPLCQYTLSGAYTAGSGSCTSGPSRMPGVASPLADSYSTSGAFQFTEGGVTSVRIAPGVVAQWGAGDLYAGGANQAYQIALLGDSSMSMAPKYGLLRGLLKHHVMFGSIPSGGAPGDTVEIGGTTWVLVGSAQIACDTGA